MGSDENNPKPQTTDYNEPAAWAAAGCAPTEAATEAPAQAPAVVPAQAAAAGLPLATTADSYSVFDEEDEWVIAMAEEPQEGSYEWLPEDQAEGLRGDPSKSLTKGMGGDSPQGLIQGQPGQAVDASEAESGSGSARMAEGAQGLSGEAAQEAAQVEALTPEQRIARLIEAMPGQRPVLCGIIDFCREPRNPSELDEYTEGLQKAHASVYTPVLLRQHLQTAGALVYHGQDEEVQDEEVQDTRGLQDGQEVQAPDASPVHEEVARPGALAGSEEASDRQGFSDRGGTTQGGSAGHGSAEAVTDGGDGGEDATDATEVEYLVVSSRPVGKWVSSAAGLAYIDSFDPASELEAMLAEEPQYLEIYLRILESCAQAPRTKTELNDLVDSDPLVQSPRRYSGYFIDRLDCCGALKWSPRWEATTAGREYLSAHGKSQQPMLEEGGAQ
ncbi:MAG: hypothetical protein LBG81_07690 [Coriobacteriaceae bacterium]|jgi:hypothetical protein|nr:hypothetical protein [Coriobacteriaceae bacterium]